MTKEEHWASTCETIEVIKNYLKIQRELDLLTNWEVKKRMIFWRD